MEQPNFFPLLVAKVSIHGLLDYKLQCLSHTEETRFLCYFVEIQVFWWMKIDFMAAVLWQGKENENNLMEKKEQL